MKIGQCRLCKREKKICKSHIIPSAFFRAMLGDGESTFFQLQIGTGVRVKRRGGQQWDRLLCVDCERKLKVYEDYVIDILLRHKSVKISRIGEDSLLEGIDYKALRLFQLSILWRAGLTNLPMFKKVRLLEHEDLIRNMIAKEIPGEPHEYPCLMLPIFIDEQVYSGDAQFMIQADELPFRNHKSYILLFGSFIWIFVLGIVSEFEGHSQQFSLIDKNGTLLTREMNVREVPFLNKMFAHVYDSGAISNFFNKIGE